MSLRKRIASLAICGTLVLGSINFAFADGARVVTIGVNNSPEQRATILKYFGVNENEVVVLEVNNQEERKYLEGVASEAQLGKKTYSCAYVEPTKAGSGINVKTANLTWLTSSMVASTLSTAGLTDADVVVASTFPVSGTGALTGIMKAFEDSTGKPLEEEKKELASEELIITGDLGEDIGADKATGIVNDIKTLFGQYEDLYKDMKTFLIHHTHILYKYMQQLLEPSIADYLKKQKEEKMDKLAEVAVTEDDCKVCTVLKQNVEAEYLNSCIDFWNDFKEANGEVKGSENGWAAAVEYHIKKVAGQVITQAQISKKYEISPSTLGKRYKDLKA